MKIRSLTLDGKKTRFKSNSAAEKDFARALRAVATTTGHIISRYTKGAEITDEKELLRHLKLYSEQIGPWARRQSERLIEKISSSNKRAYKSSSKAIGQIMNTKIVESETGMLAQSLITEQVDLIKSIPIEAGHRAQEIAKENFLNGRRAIPDPEVVKDLEIRMGMSTEVATNRAKLIARTETAKANSAFVEARALAIGSNKYIWRTSMDGAERKSHAKMNGKTFSFNNPPTLIDGTTGNPGTFPNCRCYAEPILPDLDE